MKDITSGRIADLRDIIVMPIAVNADLFTAINQKVKRGTSCSLVLVFIFSPGLGACSFTRLNFSESCCSTHHSRVPPVFRIPKDKRSDQLHGQSVSSRDFADTTLVEGSQSIPASREVKDNSSLLRGRSAAEWVREPIVMS
jgi:hypothetical protein